MQKFNPDYASPAGIRAVVFDFGGVLFDWNPQNVPGEMAEAVLTGFFARVVYGRSA